MADNEAPDTEEDSAEITPSEADELTHAELLCLYDDSERNIRFAKLFQWRMTAGTLAIFVLFALLAPQYGKDAGLTKMLTLLTYVVAGAAIYTLAIFQSWQGTEREKVHLIIGAMSSLAREIYHTKSSFAANIERYVLLGFMAGAILIGGFLALCRLMRWFAG